MTRGERIPRRRRSTRSHSAKGLRLFVAIYPPPHVVQQMLAAARAHLDEHALRYDGATVNVVPLEQVHLTVHFLGNVAPRQLDATIESIDRAKKGLGGFTLIPADLIVLPPGAPQSRPRLIAVETDAPPDLLELQRRLATRFARPARDRPGDRFLPHLTLARFKWGGGGEPLTQPTWRPLPEQSAPKPFEVDEFRLVKSVLQPRGAEHRSVAKWPLVLRGGAER